ncbi:MAG: prolipoprotein diacylglyceryl transferase [Cyclobacteriaceae bacterium]|nr:prolipoprotein diacylglyceryl transferase [Cyclobacteriaceae bacterium]
MNLFNYIIWSPNPEIFPGIDWIEVRWYGLLFAAGFIVSQQLMYYIFRSEGKPEKDVDSLTLWMIIATIIGARLGHVIFYEPMRYLQDPVSILKTWEGGLASHGAAVGILLAIYLYINYFVDINPFKGKFVWKKQKRSGQSYLWVVDRIVICVAITGAFIRFGNFLNAEIIGTPTRSEYGVVFARDVIDRLEYMPQIDEVSLSKNKEGETDENGYVPVQIALTFDASVNSEALARQIVQTSVKSVLSSYEYVTLHIYEPNSSPLQYEIHQNTSGLQTAVIHSKGIARHPAQLYESISSLLLFVLLLYLWFRKKEKLTEGLLFGVFLVILFGLRFVYEYLKENQVAFEDSMSLNMGQILSIPLTLAGIWLLLNLKKVQPKPSKE